MQSHNSLEQAPMGVSSSIIYDLKLAMTDLSTLRRVVFSSMDTGSKDFALYLEVIST